MTLVEMQRKPATLQGRSQSNLTLMEAIANCQACFSEATGLFYSPEACFLATVRGTSVVDAQGAEVNLGRVFEARIFNVEYELRWLNEFGGHGTAVLLSEQDIAPCLADELPVLEAIDTQDQQYLLWGEGYRANLQPGWSRLATSRLGKLDVPIAGVNHSKQRVQLVVKEYFRRMDELYGNVMMAEERLCQLQQL
jgi:CRISPR-associated protein (TIGR03984 family)